MNTHQRNVSASIDPVKLDRLAEVAVRVGLHLREGQDLLLTAPVVAMPLVRRIAEHAYKAGAGLVTPFFSDEELTLSRYRHALRARDAANPPAWVGNIPQRHDLYWKTEANMAEGNPMLILEKGEKVLTPPAIWIQGQPDIVHDYRDPDAPIEGNEPQRFVTNYRKAGGEIDLLYIDNAKKAGAGSFAPAAEFFHRHITT